MIEAYFHTMLLLQEALKDDGADGTVFIPRPELRANTAPDPNNQWLLSPGPIDLGEGTQMVLPPTLRARSIGIGVVDADETQREIYGTDVSLVTVTAAVGIEDEGSWFVGKQVSSRIAGIEQLLDPAGPDISYRNFEDDCNIKPKGDPDSTPEIPGYGLKEGSLRTTALCLIQNVRSEAFLPDQENDVYIFWRSFLLELAVKPKQP